jgi:hypothetical protein
MGLFSNSLIYSKLFSTTKPGNLFEPSVEQAVDIRPNPAKKKGGLSFSALVLEGGYYYTMFADMSLYSLAKKGCWSIMLIFRNIQELT